MRIARPPASALSCDHSAPSRAPARAGALRHALGVAALLLASAAGAQAPPPQAAAIDPALLARAAELVFVREVTPAPGAEPRAVDHRLKARARYAATPLMTYVRSAYPATADWDWSLAVVTRNEPIAFLLPTGRIVVSTGLFDRMRLTDHEYAAIIAHLLAHALSGDDARAAAAAYERARGSPGPDADINRASLQLADILTTQLHTRHYDAAAEKAATILGVDLLARSGIDPRAAVSAWRKVAEAGGATPPGFLALHPVGNEQIADVEAKVKLAVPVYDEVAANRSPPQKKSPVPPKGVTGVPPAVTIGTPRD